MTNFTRECIAKGGFVAVGMRKSSQQNVGAATPTKICKRGQKPNINVKKNSSCRFCGVNFTSGGGQAAVVGKS